MRRLFFWVTTATVLALLVAGISWLRQQQLSARRLAEWQAQREEDAIPPVLLRDFEWESADLTIDQFAALLAEKSGLSVELNEDIFLTNSRWRAQRRDLMVQVPRGAFPLPVLAQMVLGETDLCADVRSKNIFITTRKDATDRISLRTAVYPLPQPKPRGLTESDWAQIIDANIHGYVEAVPGAIVVVAAPAEQRRAQLVIDTICSLRDDTPGPVVIPPPPLAAAEKRILAALDAPASIDVIEMPLKDLMLYLVESHGIPLVLAADKLAEASVSIDTPITKSLNGISLRSVLRLILKDLELTYLARDDAVLITTPEDAESRLRTVAYPIHDLTGDDKRAEPQSIIDLVTACLDPGMWRIYGGPGLMHEVADGWLVVEQTEEIHDQIAALVAVLRRMLAAEGHLDAQSIAPSDEAGRKIRAALDRHVELDLDDMPLKDAVEHLAELLEIPIVLSFKKMEEASVSPDTPITRKLDAGPAVGHLETILKDLELDYVVRDEVLQITTPEDVESQLVTRIYDTRSLLSRVSADRIIEQVTRTIQPQQWDIVGGPGDVKIWRGLMVVTHVDRVHEEIEKLLLLFAEQEEQR